MSKPALLPILDADLEEFCRFANEQFGSHIMHAEWVAAFSRDWCDDKPNNGFMLKVNGDIVGAIGAIYGSRFIRGEREHFCNITSWCVLDAYRAHSMRLASALIAQKQFHFTDFTPTEVVARTLKFFKFKALDPSQILIPHLPRFNWSKSAFEVIDDGQEIARCLTDHQREVFLDHSDIPWIRQVVIRGAAAPLHIVYKPTTHGRFRCAVILAVSDRDTFTRSHRVLARYLLREHGIRIMRLEQRLLTRKPFAAIRLKGTPRKLYLTETLEESDIDSLYCELTSMDLGRGLF